MFSPSLSLPLSLSRNRMTKVGVRSVRDTCWSEYVTSAFQRSGPCGSFHLRLHLSSPPPQTPFHPTGSGVEEEECGGDGGRGGTEMDSKVDFRF